MLDDYTCNMHIDRWRMRRIIEEYEAARGKVKSMISVIIPARGENEISRFTKMLDDDLETALNTGNRSLLRSMTSAKTSLKLYDKDPLNGLILYSGTILTDDDGKEKNIAIAFEPYRPIYTPLYECDDRFHTEALSKFLESNDKDDKFGFIVMDYKGALFTTLSGNTFEVLHQSKVNLPIIRDVEGGQSAYLMEKRHDYVRGTALLAEKLFIDPATEMCRVSGLILAGSVDLQTELSQSGKIHALLKEKIKESVHISTGGKIGLNEAIDLSYKSLADVKLLHEKCMIRLFLKRISEGERNYVVGVDATLRQFKRETLRYLIVWENLDINRYVLKNSATSETTVKHLNKEQEADESNFRDPETNAELEVEEKTSLLEWLAYSDYKKFKCRLVFVSDRFQEGSQFCRGFGGIGGIYSSYHEDYYEVKWPVYDEKNPDEENHVEEYHVGEMFDEENHVEEYHVGEVFDEGNRDEEASDEETSDEERSDKETSDEEMSEEEMRKRLMRNRLLKKRLMRKHLKQMRTTVDTIMSMDIMIPNLGATWWI